MTACRSIVLGTAMGMAALALPAHAQEGESQDHHTRIGVVNVGHIMENAQAAQSLSETIQGRQENFQQEIQKRERELQQARKELRQQQEILSDEALQRRQQELQQNMQRFRQDVQQMRQRVGQMRQQGRAEIRRIVSGIVQEIAAEKDLALVVSRNQAIYVEDRHNVTDEVLKRFDANVDEISLPEPSQAGGGQAGMGAGGQGTQSGDGLNGGNGGDLDMDNGNGS